MSTGLAGIGMVMAATGDSQLPYVVNDVDPSGSAYQDGRVRVGDAILELDGKSVAGLGMDQIIPLVRGKPGSTYVLCGGVLVTRVRVPSWAPCASLARSWRIC